MKRRLGTFHRRPGLASGIVLLGLAVAGSAPASGQGADALPLLERASRVHGALKAFCADFEQEMRVPLLNQVTRSRGRLCQRQPDLFSMRFSDPAGDLVLADGEHLWIYFKSTDPTQVFQSPMSAGGGQFDFHREFLSEPGHKYVPTLTGRETVGGIPTRVLRLVPRAPSVYREARVWIDEESGHVRRIEIEEENGSVRRVDLTNLAENPTFPEGYFRFTPPPGVGIIRR